jgi:hypothetical protein
MYLKMKIIPRYAHIKALTHNIAAIKTLVIKTHNTIVRTTHHHGTHKSINGTTYQIMKLQNRSSAVFINNFKPPMMTSVGRNI